MIVCFNSLQGGFEYKRAIVDCIISIIEENPESKETGLAHLCEFIEDCEHTVLATKILHLLGKEGPRTPQPSKYIRFIFNRVVLESEAVRAGVYAALKTCFPLHFRWFHYKRLKCLLLLLVFSCCQRFG